MRPLVEPAKFQRATRDVWRPDPPAEDTAPADPAVARVAPEDWGVTAERAREMLADQMCPVCGEGPWKSPLNHVSRKHGIDNFTMRDACGLTVTASVVDPALSERISDRGKQRDMSAMHAAARRRKPQRWTQAGLDTQRATLAAWEEANPDLAREQRLNAARASKSEDARAKQGESLREWYTAHPEARNEARARLARSSEELSEQARAAWERRGLKPCGTRAAWRRGCRCDDCRAAHLAYRKAHG